MTIMAIHAAAFVFNYDIVIDGDKMVAHVYMDGVYSHDLEII